MYVPYSSRNQRSTYRNTSDYIECLKAFNNCLAVINNRAIMAELNLYPANMAPSNALVARRVQDPAHAVELYSGHSLEQVHQGPLNPFKDEKKTLKRKGILTGEAQEIYLSEQTFRNYHRGAQSREGISEMSTAQLKAERERMKAKRQKQGDATIAEGDGAYVGPWAKYEMQEYDKREAEDNEELASDEEYEEVEEDDQAESGALVAAMPQALVKRAEDEANGNEISIFEGSEQYDYQGRTYMHVPQDLDLDLRQEPGSIKNYAPKKLIHTWRHGTQPITSVKFFPNSGHLLLSASADTKVKLWDVYHQQELLRSYSGHTKSICNTDFNSSGTQFLTASYDRMIKLWDTETGTCIASFTTGKTPHVVKFNPSPEHAFEFLAGMSDKKIVQFDIRTKEIVQEYDHHLAAINTIEFCDENRRFMTTSDDKSLRAWDYNIPVPIKFIAEPYMYPMVSASPHPSGKYMVYQSSDNQIVVFGATDKFRQNRKKSFRGHNNAGYRIDVSVSPDGQFVASGDTGGYVCFWDWKTCKMYTKLEAHAGAVTCVAWAPQESSKVVTAGLGGEIKFWD